MRDLTQTEVKRRFARAYREWELMGSRVRKRSKFRTERRFLLLEIRGTRDFRPVTLVWDWQLRAWSDA